MKLSETVYNYMPDDKKMKNYKKFNCAESMYRAIVDHYNLSVCEDSKVLMSAFGGGLSMGDTCGLLIGGYAALAQMFSEEKPPHAKDSLKYICRKWHKAFEAEFSDVNCRKIKPEEGGCSQMSKQAGQVFEKMLEESDISFN